MISAQELLDVHKKIRPHIHKTPVMKSRLLSELSSAELYFKCENFQQAGAFKMRGALNAILNLDEKKRKKGVVTHSSGNFGQALSLAAKSLDIPAFIVMPSSTPEVKKKAVKTYGGQITECLPNLGDRKKTASAICKKTGATFIHPSNQLDVIYGNATAAIELFQDCPTLDYVIAPVGGGGLLAGTALATHHFSPDCKILGAEPFAVDDAYRALKSGKIESNSTTNTLADGLKTQLGDKNLPILKALVDCIIRVEEAEIIPALKLLLNYMKIVVEPSAAVAFAAILRKSEKFKNKKVGVLLSGGNADLLHILHNFSPREKPEYQ